MIRAQKVINPCVYTGFDVDKAVKEYHKYYDYLYENEDKIVGYDLLVNAGDCYGDAYKSECMRMCVKMNDIIGSDRETAAFALAMHSLGMDIRIKFDDESEDKAI